jgi:cytoskeleton protein RodZ
MSESWNVENVAESKPETSPEKPPLEAAAPVIPSVLSNDHSLGKIMAMAREARGFTREQAAKSSNIPGYYLTMIESDDYSSIADQLYLLPFLRRYAAFVGLEAEEVASRFIRDVQRADMNPPRLSSEPMMMIADRKPFPWSMVMLAGGAVVIAALGWFGYRHFMAKKSSASVAPASEAAQPAMPQAASSASAAQPDSSSQTGAPPQNGAQNNSDDSEPDTAAVAAPPPPSASSAMSDSSAANGKSVITSAPAARIIATAPSGDQSATAMSLNGHPATKSSRHKPKPH